jgi:hypothetical protein
MGPPSHSSRAHLVLGPQTPKHVGQVQGMPRSAQVLDPGPAAVQLFTGSGGDYDPRVLVLRSGMSLVRFRWPL